MNNNLAINDLSQKEYWLLQLGINLYRGLKVSATNGMRRIVESEIIEPEEQDNIIRIINEKLNLLATKQSSRSVIVDKSDLLPSSFLEIGARLSLAVCRIARYFSLEEFRSLLEQENIDTSLDEKQLQEIFGIPNQIMDDLYIVKGKRLKGLEGLREINETQLAAINPIAIGTGFLVGGTHLLTNNHVIPNEEIARQCVAQFNYVTGDQNYTAETTDYEFAPEIFFVTEPDLDYTLVQLKSGMFTRQAGYRFGWIQLVEKNDNVCSGFFYIDLKTLQNLKEIEKLIQNSIDQNIQNDILSQYIFHVSEIPDNPRLIILPKDSKTDIKKIKSDIDSLLTQHVKILEGNQIQINQQIHIHPQEIQGDGIIIIQHPKGKHKQIVVNDNKMLNNGLYNNFLRYKADSDYGSSGSPAFNLQWELVGIHHAAVGDQQNDKLQLQNSSSTEESNLKEVKIVAQQGVRICRIIEDLKEKSFKYPKLAGFIEDFVVTSEQLSYPPFVSALELNGENSYIDLNDQDLDIHQGITFEAWIKRNSVSGDGIIMSYGSSFYISWERGNIWIKKGHTQKAGAIKSVLNDDRWHHIALTLRKGKKEQEDKISKKEQEYLEIKLYLDGENLDIYRENFDLSLEIPREKLYLGYKRHNQYYDNTINYFSGLITEVRLWKLIRNQEDIQKNIYRRLSKDDQEGLTGYWRFEEVESCKVYNLAKSGIATLKKEEKLSRFNKFGLYLNGKSDYIDCGNDENLKIEKEITIEVWVKSSRQQESGIIVNRGGSWDQPGYCIWKYRNKIRVELKQNTEIFTIFDTVKTFDTFDTFEAIPNNNNQWLHQWLHIACTWSMDSELKDVKIYINGERQDTIHVSSEKGAYSCEIGEPQVNLNIGRAQGYGYYFSGVIAEVRLWNIARTEDQIKQNQNSDFWLTGEKSGLVGYWQLDEEEGNTAKNLVSENGYGDAIVHGGRWLKPFDLLANNQGAYGWAFDTKRFRASQYPGLPLPFGLQFSKKGSRVECGSSKNLNTPEAITVEAWAKHKFGNCPIVRRGGNVNIYSGKVEQGYSLGWYDGKIRVALSNASEKTIIYSKENAPIDRIWHHIAFTWDKISQEIALYIDGRRQDSIVEGKSNAIVVEGQSKTIGLFAGLLDKATASLIIGQNQTEETQYYDIAIAEVRLWKIARTQDQIKANMSRRLTDIESDLVGYWRLDDGGEDNKEVQNLVPNSQPGTIYGATWFPQPPKLPENKTNITKS
jgi:V8-like Glu-specific endopeptidase